MATSNTPVSDYFQEKVSVKKGRKEHELGLWQAWKDGGEQAEHLAPLLKLYEPIIAQKVRQWKPPQVPESAFKAELQTHTIKAFQSYDPTRGAALNTHVESRLPKAMRYGNRGANLQYLPEEQARSIGKLTKAKDLLTEELGRAPTNDEIADNVGLTPKRVGTILGGMKRDIPMSRSGGAESYDYGNNSAGTGRDFEEQQIAVAQHILPDLFPGKPDIHSLFHYTFGTGGFPQVHSTSELAKRLNKSESQISRMKTHMGEILRKNMGLDDEK